MKYYNKRNRYIKKQLNRMQDFEYEFSNVDIKDLSIEDQKLLKEYEVNELDNYNYFEYVKRIAYDG